MLAVVRCQIHHRRRGRLGRRRLVVPAVLAACALALPAGATADSAATPPTVVSITAVNGRPVGGIKRVTIKKGKTVRIVIRTNVGKRIHLHGYNVERTVVKGKPTVITFVARIPGRFELELHSPDTLLAQITVR